MIKMPSGVPVNKVRVFANTANPMQLKNHVTASDKEYKTPYYVTAAEGSYFRLGVFELNGKLSVKPDNLLAWAQNHKRVDYVPLDQQDGFIGYISPGSMAIAKASDVENVEKLPTSELRKRAYTTLSVGGDGDNRAQFRYALAAGMKKDLGSLASEYTLANPPLLLRMSPNRFLSVMLFENIHFKIMLDGTIVFLK